MDPRLRGDDAEFVGAPEHDTRMVGQRCGAGCQLLLRRPGLEPGPI